jgi:signal transduction histidine kinase
MLSDDLNYPIHIDSIDTYVDFKHFIVIKKYNFILVCYSESRPFMSNILGDAAGAGIPVIFMLDETHAAYDQNPIQRGDNDPYVYYVVDREWRFVFMNCAGEAGRNGNCEALQAMQFMKGKLFWECFPHFIDIPARFTFDTDFEKQTDEQLEAVSPKRQFWVGISACSTQNGGVAVFLHDITGQRNAAEALRIIKERQDIMLRLSDSLRLLDNPGDIHAAAARVIGEYLGVDAAFYCDVITIDGREYFLRESYYAIADIDIPLGLHPNSSPGVLAQENYEGRNIIVTDMENDPRISEALRPSLRECRLGAWVSVPFFKYGRFVASFTVHQAAARDWTPDEVSLIEETTARTWAEVERVRAEIAQRESEKHALQLVSELENAARNKNEFINALSHELRNPLAAIVASLSMLDILDQNPDTRKPREIIKRQTDQLCHLVDDLLDLTRITNNKINLNLETVELNALVQSSVLDHKTLFAEKGVLLETDISEEPLFISADPVRLSQVIDNLLHNASKFTEKGGRTVIETRERNHSAVITVRDDGIGIEPSFLPDLFKTFKQAGHHKGGLGLGLSIVKGIAELHGGSVVAESGGLHKGAAFTVTLPLIAQASKAVAADAGRETALIKSLKILLIDDNRDLVDMTCSFLTLLGYNVASAQTGCEGIRRVKSFRPQVIICDIGLPDINGYEVAKRLSTFEGGNGICLISLSGYAQAGDVELSREAGFDYHLSKPLDFTKLRTILDTIL